MLQSFDYLDEILERQHRTARDMEPAYYASELLEALGYSLQEAGGAMERAMQACAALHIPVELNFRRAYCCNNSEMEADWLLSGLAGYFLIVNCDPRHPAVARAQIHLLKKHYSF
ncbi:hypothetical protein ACFOTA_01720 [Chitinophaga sp. GCM10012297]|uniref:DNA-binding protein n=1 Tax=Chitinophaga chungangae TaxID=2821488 RepID=A0ABS3Y8B4_9BACT|nr:hypothetical protein [Chitinophaga chungangae]MBO9150912.1 hypothetical protein [Chitinophaga chungangae]